MERLGLEQMTSTRALIRENVVNEPPRIIEIDISRQARALAWLRLTDYALVIICGFWALGLVPDLVISFSAADMQMVVFDLIALAVLGYAAYTGWRHVGVINPSVWGAYNIVFPTLLLFSLFILWGTLDLLGSLDEMMEQQRMDAMLQLSALFAAAWVAVIAVVGWVSLALLRKTRITSLSATVDQILAQVAKHAGVAAASTAGIRRINTPRGLLIGGAGVLILLVHLFAPLPGNERFAEAYLRFSQQITLLAFFLLVRARRYFQIDAESLLAVDKRAVILFLRSFDDDEKQKFATSQRALLDFSLETRLSNHFFRFGPFIAVGSPEDTVPQIGAARVLLQDDEWQGRVLKWIEDASLIIMYSGATQWVNWELRQVIDSGRATSLILMFPEIREWRPSRRKESIETRVEKIRGVFEDTPWKEELMAFTDFKGLRAMLFQPDGAMVMIKSRSRSRDAYHLAALIAHQQLLARDAAASTADAEEAAPSPRRTFAVRGAMVAASVAVLAAAYLLTTGDDAPSLQQVAITAPEDNRLAFNGGEVYYGGQVSEEEARGVGEYLVREQYFTDEQPSTLELHYNDGSYELGFVIDAQYVEDPLTVIQFGTMGEEIARKILNGSSTIVVLYDEYLNPLRTVPLTAVAMFGKGELYYSEPVTAAEAKAVGELLLQVEFFSNDKATSVFLTHENDAYQLKFVTDTPQALDPELKAGFRELSRWVAVEALGNQALVFHLCDDHFRPVQSERL
jgi:hypothetical protein